MAKSRSGRERVEEPDGRTDAERRFVARLRALLHPLIVDVWVDHPQLVASVDVRDPDHKRVLRVLRVDFYGGHIAGGTDPTYQCVGDLNPTDPAWFAWGAGAAPDACAEIAAAFITRQYRRPIDRLEWHVGTGVKRQWVLADVGTVIVTSGDIPQTPPTRIVRVSSHTG